MLIDGGPTFGKKARQPLGILAHRPTLYLPKLHKPRHLKRRTSIKQQNPVISDSPVNIFHKQSEGQEGEFGVAVPALQDVLCEVYPACEAVFDVVSVEFD